MAWNYTDKVKMHFFEPKNVGKIKEYNGIGEVGSIACGDALTLTLKVDKETDLVIDAKFQTFGCGSAIASSSMLTEMIKGKTLDQALKVTNQDIADALGGLPPEKMHCSVMGREALEAAIADYRGLKIVYEDDDEGKIICNCFGITEGKLRKVIKENNLKTAEDVEHYTKAGGGCGACLDDIEDILEEMSGAQLADKPSETKKKNPLTNLQRITFIQEILEHEVQPILQKDDGGLELIDIEGLNVSIKMTGHCQGCRAAGLTTKWIEDKLKELVDPAIVLKVTEE